MAIRIVRLGSPRAPQEGLRIGTVRRPPRGVRKSQYGRRNFFDVWFPLLSPSPTLVHAAKSARDAGAWRAFARRFRAEMRKPEPARALDLLAALSHTANLAVGCYCEDESHCHRVILRDMLRERGADVR